MFSLEKSRDSHLLRTTALIIMLGVLSIYGASAMKGYQVFNNPYFFLTKQFGAIALGVFAIGVIRAVPFLWIERLHWPVLIFSLFTLSLIFIPNLYTKVGGASRWLHIGFVRFQPGEFAKLALVFFLAKNLSRPSFQIQSLKHGVLPNVLVLALFALFLMKQPDFGSTVVLLLITAGMLFVAGALRRHVVMAFLSIISLLALAIVTAPYRMKRLVGFLNPWDDINHAGFQIVQSYLAFQNGGLLGVGLGESRQKLFFLPEAHTDFILSVIAEELGLMGNILVAFLYLHLILTAYAICKAQEVPFRKFLSFGLTTMLAIQACMNIGVVMGLLPTKGIPLPLVSSGTSSLLTFLISIGILSRLNLEATSS